MKSDTTLTDVLKKNKQNLSQDMNTLLHLDPIFHNKEITVVKNGKPQKISIEFSVSQTKNSTIDIGAKLKFPDHSQKDVAVVRTTPNADGSIDYVFLQDESLDGATTVVTKKIQEPYEYTPVRNQICQQFHDIVVKQYSNQNAIKLIRSFLKKEQGE